jgi:hypothetical protein
MLKVVEGVIEKTPLERLNVSEAVLESLDTANFRGEKWLREDVKSTRCPSESRPQSVST